MNGDKLDKLFGEIRNEATETSVTEVSKWIAVSAASAGLFGLLSKFKLPFILTKKIIIMTSLALTFGIGATALFLSLNTENNENKTILDTSKIEVKKSSTAGQIVVKTNPSSTLESPNQPTNLAKTDILEIETIPLLKTQAIEGEKNLIFNDLKQPTPISPVHEAILAGNEIKVGAFNQVHVSGALDVYISQGDKASVIVDGTTEEMEQIVTKLNRGELHIKQKTNKRLKNSDLKIHITMVDITGFGVSGASSITTTERLHVSQMDIQGTGAGNMELDLNCEHIKIEATGAANIDLYGETKTMSIEATGACNIDGAKLEANEVDLTATGASNVDINASNRLYVNATGASHVTYRGDPTDVSKNASITSSITKRK